MIDARLIRPQWRGRENVDALTIACIERAEQVYGSHEFVMTQGSYQSGAGDPASAGTHDMGGVVDLEWCGHVTCILALRWAGMAAWHRSPPAFPHHIHAVVIGHPLLAPVAQRQVDAYLDSPPRNGLADNGPDDGPRIIPIPRPVWPWPPVEEDDMFTDEDRAMLKAVLKKVENSAERERRTNDLLRKLRKDIADVATLAEIDDLLAG